MRRLFAFFVMFALACGEAPAPVDAGAAGGGAGGGGAGGGGGSGGGGSADAGASDAGTPDAGVQGYASFAAYCAEDTRVLCARWLRCGLMTSVALCMDLMQNKWRRPCNAVEASSMKDGRIAFDGVAAKICHDASATRACNGRENYIFDKCAGVFRGLVPNGGSCVIDGDCAATSACSSTAMTCPGTCVARKPANTPSASERDCEVDHTLYEGVCEPKVAIGASCSPKPGKTTKRPCVDWGHCNAANLCADDLSVGGACPAGDECQVWLRCANGSCAAYNAQGTACTPNTCKWDLFCTATAAAGGTCNAPAALGASCRDRSDCAGAASCLVPAGTQVGTCIALRGQGGACGSWEQCLEGLTCLAGTCQPPRMLGQTCGSTNDCGGSLTCSGGSCMRTACFDDTP